MHSKNRRENKYVTNINKTWSWAVSYVKVLKQIIVPFASNREINILMWSYIKINTYESI